MPQETVTVPIPGKVIKVNINPGSKIGEGDTICEIESMKMENPILAPVDGVVSQVAVTTGQIVKTGETLAVIEY